MKKEKSDQNAVAELTREGSYKENKWLWEENKKLNIKVASLEGEIKGLNYTIDRLHKEIEELEKPHPRFSDFGGYYLDQ